MCLNIIEGIQYGLVGLEYQSLRDGQQEVIKIISRVKMCFLFSNWISKSTIPYYLRRVLLGINIDYARYFLTLAKSAHNKFFKVPLNNPRCVSASTPFLQRHQTNTFCARL